MIATVARAALTSALLLVSGCSTYIGEPRVPKTDLRATLGAVYEVPPTQSRATGYFEAVYRPSTKVMEYRLNLVGLSGPITGGSLNGPSPTDGTAPPVSPINIPIYTFGTNISDGVTLTGQQAAEVLAGRWYVNVMTIQYPDGEIRGQILPKK